MPGKVSFDGDTLILTFECGCEAYADGRDVRRVLAGGLAPDDQEVGLNLCSIHRTGGEA